MITSAKKKSRHTSKKHKIKPALSALRKPDAMTLEQWQTELRRQTAHSQRMLIRNMGDELVFSEFKVHNPQSNKDYRVVIRGKDPGVNYCSCPDFSINTLGTCKHIETVLNKLQRTKPGREKLKAVYQPEYPEIYLRYGSKREVIFSPGLGNGNRLKACAGRFFDIANVLTKSGFLHFDEFIKTARKIDPRIRYYDDAATFIAEWRDADFRRKTILSQYPELKQEEQKRNVTLPGIKTTLYPYQYKGAVFAAAAGRSIIADEMGLGKTVQALAAVEIMTRHFGVEKVLIVTPASLKYQWKMEIERFSERACLVIEGQALQRRRLYENPGFYTITHYEQIFRDLETVTHQPWDLIILDETQRIKNWKTRTSQSIKTLRSQYAIALTGTPLENRLEELHSIVEFIDRFKLGPLFRFLNNHQVLEPGTSKVIGYRNLSQIGTSLEPVLLRRTKKEVLTQLPGRTDKNYFVAMTEPQQAVHEDNRNTVARIVARWRKYRFLSEADHRRLMTALQFMRMVCDSTYLVDQNEHHGLKLDELVRVLADLDQAGEEKVVIFSQWERMHELMAQVLNKNKIGYVFLYGGVPARKRPELVKAFHDDPGVRVFLSTDAGGLGLNLQNASTVINMDLPWNPAVLEQRIGRVHRMGQHKPVRVINFIAEGTIEHGMLSVLAFKKSLFAGVLDGGEDIVNMGESRLNRFMKDVEKVSGSIETVTAQTTERSNQGEPTIAPRTLQKQSGGVPALGDKPSIRVESKSAAGSPDMNSLYGFLSQGASFLQGLAQSIKDGSSPESHGTGPLSALIERDTQSGRSFLKIPLPEPDVLGKLLTSLTDVIRAGSQR